MTLQEIINEIKFFETLDEKQVEKLCEIASVKTFPKDSILYYESESTNNLMFLIKGLLKVYKVDKFDNEIFLYHIHENCMISELTSLKQSDIFCFSNAEFMKDSQILCINFEKFNELFFIAQYINARVY